MKPPVSAGALPPAWAPFDPTSYARPLALQPTEQTAIGQLLSWTRAGKKGWPAAVKPVLADLLCPVYDVLDYLGISQRVKRHYTVRTTVVCLLIRAMAQHGCTFWAFTPALWRELLGQDYYAYIRLHGKTANARQHLIGVAYLLCHFQDLGYLGRLAYPALAGKVFGPAPFAAAVASVAADLQTWGYTQHGHVEALRASLAEALLAQRSPQVATLTRPVLLHLYQTADAKKTRRGLVLLSYVLVRRGQFSQPLGRDGYQAKTDITHRRATQGVPAPWLAWCNRWYGTSTLQPPSRVSTLYRLLQMGRWVAQAYPAAVTPADWTVEICAACVAAIDRGHVGQWSSPNAGARERLGKPFAAEGKEGFYRCLRTFFSDCQEWEWIPRRFTPARALRTPPAVRAGIGPAPRVIEEALWAKLVWAGVNLTAADLGGAVDGHAHGRGYPVAMIQALAVVWLFTGLRRAEIRRLRAGCIRWQEPLAQTAASSERVCLLDIPVSKTNTAFTKPVDATVGRAITAWEAVRPPQPAWTDRKTGERVSVLFCHRGRPIGVGYLNDVLIPLLCRKAGVPVEDARGPITSHRARATIASQLYNAKEPLSLVELQAWLGHASPESTQYYTQISPTRLAQSYRNAGYFARNLRAVEVLIDQDVIQSGAAAAGEPWKYYDLGHGFCTYTFFDQCAHRMACAKCSFYRPKETATAQLLEGKRNLVRMLQEIPLLDDERAAVEDGLEAMDHLLHRLAAVPTPGTQQESPPL